MQRDVPVHGLFADRDNAYQQDIRCAGSREVPRHPRAPAAREEALRSDPSRAILKGSYDTVAKFLPREIVEEEINSEVPVIDVKEESTTPLEQHFFFEPAEEKRRN